MTLVSLAGFFFSREKPRFDVETSPKIAVNNHKSRKATQDFKTENLDRFCLEKKMSFEQVVNFTSNGDQVIEWINKHFVDEEGKALRSRTEFYLSQTGREYSKTSYFRVDQEGLPIPVKDSPTVDSLELVYEEISKNFESPLGSLRAVERNGSIEEVHVESASKLLECHRNSQGFTCRCFG